MKLVNTFAKTNLIKHLQNKMNQTPLTNPSPLRHIIQELKSEPNVANFLVPVDWRSLNLKDYTEIVKQPMDISIVEVSYKA